MHTVKNTTIYQKQNINYNYYYQEKHTLDTAEYLHPAAQQMQTGRSNGQGLKTKVT